MNINLHQDKTFRHSCAFLIIDSGANITLVTKYLGHFIDETLNTYSHMYVNIIEKQNDRYLEYKQQLPEPKKITIDYNYAECKKKSKNKNDLVLQIRVRSLFVFLQLFPNLQALW